MENKGIFPFNLLNKIRDPVSECITRVVQRPCYMPIITPLIIPSKSPLIIIKKKSLWWSQILQYKKNTARMIFFLPDINNCNIWTAPKRQKLRPCYVWYATRHVFRQPPHFFFLARLLEQREQERWRKNVFWLLSPWPLLMDKDLSFLYTDSFLFFQNRFWKGF